MKAFTVVGLLLVGSWLAVGQPAPLPTSPVVLPYNYFAESGVSYDYFGKSPASTTGFGLRIGGSNAFSVTDVDTTIAVGTSYATLRTGIEYVVAQSGLFSFTGIGLAGVTNSSTGTTASFGGGAGLEYDIGSKLSKGKFSVLADFQFRIIAAPNLAATAVRPTYGIMFRKTF